MRGKARRVRHTREKAIISFDFPKNQNGMQRMRPGLRPACGSLPSCRISPGKGHKREEMNMTIKEAKKGDYITLKPIAEPKESQVWIRGEYDRESRKYSIINFADINRERFVKGSAEAFVDFTF